MKARILGHLQAVVNIFGVKTRSLETIKSNIALKSLTLKVSKSYINLNAAIK